MNKGQEYFENLQRVLARISSEQGENMEKAAEIIADTLENGRKVFAFGTGHSHMLAEELFYRAGGLVQIRPILETSLMLHESASKSTRLERLGDYGEILFEQYGIKKGDVLLLFSNSGRNGVSIDLALLSLKNGVSTIVITNMEHTMSGASRHPSGKKLYECATVAIDNCGCTGDACIAIDGIDRKVAPTSTAAGAAILNAVSARSIEIMMSRGFVPEIFASSNVDGGDEINEAYVRKYMGEIKSL